MKPIKIIVTENNSRTTEIQSYFLERNSLRLHFIKHLIKQLIRPLIRPLISQKRGDITIGSVLAKNSRFTPYRLKSSRINSADSLCQR
jgi:hypothetical protein